MWGGIECTVNRVGDAYFTQLDRSGHHRRDDDLARFAALGIRALRYPVLWETTAPDGLDTRRLVVGRPRASPSCARLGIAPDRRPRPPRQRAAPHQPARSRASPPGWPSSPAPSPRATRGSSDWTPVNEPLTTARFSALYGLWYPHARDDRAFVDGAPQPVPRHGAVDGGDPPRQSGGATGPDRRPRAGPTAPQPTCRRGRLLQRAALARLGPALRPGRSATPALELPASTAAPSRATRSVVLRTHSCPPDIIGVNYYVTSERWLDHRLERYPGRAVRRPAGVADSSTSSRSASWPRRRRRSRRCSAKPGSATAFRWR